MACGGLTYDFSKFVGGLNLEKVVGGLRSQGISTRNGGSPLIIQLKDFGMPSNLAPAEAQKMKELLCIIVHSVDLVVRTGGVEVRS